MFACPLQHATESRRSLRPEPGERTLLRRPFFGAALRRRQPQLGAFPRTPPRPTSRARGLGRGLWGPRRGRPPGRPNIPSKDVDHLTRPPARPPVRLGRTVIRPLPRARHLRRRPRVAYDELAGRRNEGIQVVHLPTGPPSRPPVRLGPTILHHHALTRHIPHTERGLGVSSGWLRQQSPATTAGH